MPDPMEVAGTAAAFVPGGGAISAAAALHKSMGAESMGKMNHSADALVESAKSGGFTVTKEGADPIIKVLDEYIERTEKMKDELGAFDQAPPLGDHSYGKKVSQYMYEAANDDRSARAALLALNIVLKKSREALLRASNQYQEQEESVEDVFRGMGS